MTVLLALTLLPTCVFFWMVRIRFFVLEFVDHEREQALVEIARVAMPKRACEVVRIHTVHIPPPFLEPAQRMTRMLVFVAFFMETIDRDMGLASRQWCGGCGCVGGACKRQRGC